MVERTPQQERAQVTIERLQSGKLAGMYDTDLLKYLLTSFVLIAGNEIDFGGPEGTWKYVRAITDLILQKLQEVSEFEGGFETARGGLGATRRSHSIEEFFGLPYGVLPSSATVMDVGRVAGAVVAFHAPQLVSIVPPEYLPLGGPEVHVEQHGLSEEEMRRILREEMRRGVPPKGGIPRIEFNPNFLPPPPPTETEPAPVVTPVVTPPPTGAVPPNFPNQADIATYGPRELQALFRAWARLAKGEVFPPRDVLDTARARWVEVFHFPAPGDLVPESEKPPEPQPQQAPLPPPPVPPTPTVPEVSPPIPTKGQRLEEKYRPHFLAEIVGHRNIVRQLESIVRTGDWPSCMLFYGPPGTGKSTAASAVARSHLRLLGQRANIPEMGSPDIPLRDQGVVIFGSEDLKGEPSAFVTERIIPTLRTMAMGQTRGIRRIIILNDVLEKLSPEAQRILLNPLENTRGTVIFTTNDISKVIPALRSRCATAAFEFRPLTSDEILRRLSQIVAEEHVAIPEDRLTAIARESNGDLRMAVGLLAGAIREIT